MHRPTLHLRQIKNLLQRADAIGLSSDAKQRLHWFSFALTHGGNVSLACRHFGIARSTYVRWMQRFDPRDPDTLEEHSRRPHTVRAPETDARVIALIKAYRQQEPLVSKDVIQERLRAEHGVTISSSTVGRIIARHKFFFADTESHRIKRMEEPFTTSLDATLRRALPKPEQASADAGVGDAVFPFQPNLPFSSNT